ncbi:MAG: cobaltochelatase subunit CobN [Synergistaceae bacterium]|jgi:cobaltochelatase CobN|nr:cobaltochelatase subunit CobN [Synergistaceae bacterium]
MRRSLGLFFVLSLFAGAASAGAKGSAALIVIDADSYVVQRAVSDLELPEGFTARAFCASDLAEAARFLRDSSVIVVDVMDNALSRYIIDNGLLDGRKVLALRGSQDDVSLKAKGFLFDEEISSYYMYLRTDNVQNMLKRALVLATGAEIAYEPVKTTPDDGLYHPEAGVDGVFTSAEEYLRWYRSAPNQPWLGLMFFSTSLADGQREAFDDLIRKLERGGFNVLPAFGKDQAIIESYFIDGTGKRRVDAVLSFSLKFYMSLSEGLAQSIASLDVPIFNAINMYSATIGEWQKSEAGIPALDVIWTMATPEISGVIEPTPLMGKVRGANGGTVYRYELIPGMIERLVPRLHNWIKLRKTPNAEKKIAILYYNNSQGKQNIGASYLNVFRSLEEILDGMKRAGYNIDLKLDEEEIKGLVLRGGRNIGSWAPGELDALVESTQVVKLPLSRYREWLAELPGDFRARVIGQYGDPATSDLMIKDGNIIIPMVKAGNVILLPEPARGAADDPMKLYHDPLLYPHHQYLAAYLWLEKEFGADAMVHLGTHATYEWMPGKQAGLSLSCPPEVLITNIPNIYPYIVDDVGEGIQAKRRGRGVVIDHLTPALTIAEGYGEYAELNGLCADYQQAKSMDAATAELYLEKIRAAVTALGLNKDLGLGEIASADVLAIAQYLEYLDDVYVPYGLHTFGRSPDSEQRELTVGAILKQNPDLPSSVVVDKLKRSGPEEMSHFLRALEGHYVPPAEGSDPVRNPAVIPTGRNFYGLSPNRLPTPEAWRLGQKAAKEIVEKYIKEKGAYPDKVAVVLWAVESLRNEGLNESTILSLIGVEPVWGPTGVVTGTRPIPATRLGRPRVDVAVDVSGLYRDLFPDKVLFIDAAIRQAAAQDDIENFIRRNDQRIKEKLIEAGMSERDAGRFSRARVFSEAPGAYGNRVEELVSASGLWEDESTVAEVFHRHTGYAYSGDFWGTPAESALIENLRDAKVAWHSVSSQYYGLMDNDDMFMYLGGLSMAIRSLSGASPRTMIADQRTLGDVKMEELSKFLGAEMRSRYLNPKWIEGMKAENYAGAREMSNYVEYLWGWQATTPDDVDESAWEQTYQVYVEDKYGVDIKNFMDENNPWAYQSLTGRMLETARKGYWNASEEARRKLAVEYAVSVVNRGLACCDHTCNNPRFHQMVMNLISIPGLMSPEIAAEFKLAVEKAGQKTLEEMTRTRANLLKNLGELRPSQTPRSGLEADSSSQSVKGFKMENVKNAETSTPSSGAEWFASLFVLTLLALFYIGLRRGKK